MMDIIYIDVELGAERDWMVKVHINKNKFSSDVSTPVHKDWHKFIYKADAMKYARELRNSYMTPDAGAVQVTIYEELLDGHVKTWRYKQ